MNTIILVVRILVHVNITLIIAELARNLQTYID